MLTNERRAAEMKLLDGNVIFAANERSVRKLAGNRSKKRELGLNRGRATGKRGYLLKVGPDWYPRRISQPTLSMGRASESEEAQLERVLCSFRIWF